jgi:hypothetical protein
MAYKVTIISPEEKDTLYDRHQLDPFYTCKADVHGCAIKLYTKDHSVKDRWEDNFYAMSEGVRSHGRVIMLDGRPGGPEVLYEPLAKTAFLFNIDYYGWVKSIALAVAGDILEDEHRIHSVHGAALDMDGKGVALIAPSKTGKTTHAWGLLRCPRTHLISDDWFFVRMIGEQPFAYGSEKNCYVDADIGKVWPEYEELLGKAVADDHGRTIVNLRWVTGPGSVVPSSDLRYVLLMKRDPGDQTIVREICTAEAMEHLRTNDLCNPHQLVRDARKVSLRLRFFERFLDGTKIFLVNTIADPRTTQVTIRKAMEDQR